MSEQLQLRRGTSSQVASFIGQPGECVVATTDNRIVINDGATTGGWPAATVQLDITSLTGGVITFESSYDNGANWVTTPLAQFFNASLGQCSEGTNPYTLPTGTAVNQPFVIATNVKASPGVLWDVTIIQTTTTLGDFRLYDSASAPTCSSATGVVGNYPVQSNATSPGLHLPFPAGKKFVNGIAFCLTGAVADNDNTNFVTGVQLNLDAQ